MISERMLNIVKIGQLYHIITLKDHKENFVNNPRTRLINPAKNEIGRISKAILDSINKEMCNTLEFNQWKNPAGVINWFKSLEKQAIV